MSIAVFDQFEVALQQLETALALYESERDYFSVITLAGAAEEIFGYEVQARGGSNSLRECVASAQGMFEYLYGDTSEAKVFASRANRARNSLKHFRRDGTVELDPKEEARDMLNRAVDNFWHLEARLTPSMERFTRQQHPP